MLPYIALFFQVKQDNVHDTAHTSTIMPIRGAYLYFSVLRLLTWVGIADRLSPGGRFYHAGRGQE